MFAEKSLYGLYPPVSQLRQNHRIALSGNNGVENRQSTLPRNVTEHGMDLHLHLGEGLLHRLHVRRRHLHQAVAVTQQGADNTNSILRAEGGPQQPHRVEILQPLAIDPIAVAPRNVLDLLGVDQAYLEACLFLRSETVESSTLPSIPWLPW
jgi:hypothetical protein